MKLLSLLALTLLFVGCTSQAQHWPQYMGPNRDGSISAPDLFEGDVSLEQLWIQPLGSGFSGIVIGGDKLFTMHTADEMDALSCFDSATGKKLWTFEYGPTFTKAGSSEPGPLSTPALDGKRVYGLGARGELFCLQASNGKMIWARNIIKELGAVPREVGGPARPWLRANFYLNVGDQKDKSIVAFHKTTGELAWHLGQEAISFQSPALVNYKGREQLVAMSESKIRGLDPASGELIWEKDSKSWIQAFGIGEDLLLTGQYHGMSLFQIADNGLTQKWYNDNIKLEYDMPVHHKGYLYGFKYGALHCLNLENGEPKWTSPDIGSAMAILVGSHLALINLKGELKIVRAWEQSYQERAYMKVFEEGGLTAPSYANGVLYMRSYSQLTAVKVK